MYISYNYEALILIILYSLWYSEVHCISVGYIVI